VKILEMCKCYGQIPTKLTQDTLKMHITVILRKVPIKT